MNPRRRPRLFLDHKAPLVAFVLVTMTSLVMMVHMVRSDAAPGWLRDGATIAGGPVFAQRVLSGTLLERDVPAEAPIPAAEDATQPTDPTGPTGSALASIPSDATAPPADGGHAPEQGQGDHDPQSAYQPVGTPVSPASPSSPGPPSAPAPGQPPPSAPDKGGRDHGYTDGHWDSHDDWDSDDWDSDDWDSEDDEDRDDDRDHGWGDHDWDDDHDGDRDDHDGDRDDHDGDRDDHDGDRDDRDWGDRHPDLPTLLEDLIRQVR